MSTPLLALVADCLGRADIPFALIGASALAVHGVTRSTLDQDLLVTEVRALAPATWSGLPGAVTVDARRGDDDDPLAGVVRLSSPGERDVDVVIGRAPWNRGILARAVPTPTPHGVVPVVTAPDLVLLKLYAGGAQDLWDIEGLRATGVAGLDADVEARLDGLPGRCREAWAQIVGRR